MSGVSVPEGSGFGLDNLPYGVFHVGSGPARIGTRVGDQVVDVGALLGERGEDRVLGAASLNPLMAQGPERWRSVRDRLGDALSGGLPDGVAHPLGKVRLGMPFEVADYVDFYASEHHAANIGRILRPDAEPLMPNWKHLPVGYHGRAGTVVCSGTDIVRPCGQRKAPSDPTPTLGPSQRLDIEAEIGFVVGVGSAPWSRVGVDEFDEHVFGVVIVNDWSARDIQAWEYVPLGPNLAKSFATSISPWVVPLAALDAARVPLPPQDPEPLGYLRSEEPWGLDIDLCIRWNGEEVSHPPYRSMYWSPAQMLAHMTVNGATTRTGDLFASGTVSGPQRTQRGSLIELAWGGSEPVRVGGEERSFLLDGDRIEIAATAPGPGGRRIDLGAVAATILPSR